MISVARGVRSSGGARPPPLKPPLGVVDKSEKETSDLEEMKDVEVKSVEITY